MPFVGPPSHAKDPIDNQVSTKLCGVVEEAVAFDQLPPIWVPTKCGFFVIEESGFLFLFLFLRSLDGVGDIYMMKTTNKIMIEVPLLTKTSRGSSNHKAIDRER